ncbi:MAG: MCP four helix bundle domain-containing protein, partial [Nitrospirota bacterium]
MKWYYNLKIGTKLLSGFFLVAFIAGIIGYVGITNIKKIEEADIEMYELNTKPLGELGDVAVAYQRIRVNLRDIIINDNTEEMKKNEMTIHELEKVMEDGIARFETSIRSEEIRKETARLKDALQKYGPLQDQIIKLAMDRRNSEALKLMRGEGAALARTIDETVGKLFELKVGQAKQKSDNNSATARAAVSTAFTLAAIGVAVAIGLGIFISRMISVPLKKGVAFATAIANGDLNQSIDLERKDEVGELAATMNRMAEKLREIVADVKSAADNVASGSQELSASAEQMSQGATEQAAAAEEASSSMEQMSSNIKQNADNAQQTEKIAIKSAKDAQESGKAVVEAV